MAGGLPGRWTLLLWQISAQLSLTVVRQSETWRPQSCMPGTRPQAVPYTITEDLLKQ